MSTIVVMGVSGAGKSTIGRALAAELGAVFVEGDDLHPPENVMLMASGQPLSDAERRPWLDAIATEIVRHRRDGARVVVSCSALRRTHRDRLRRVGDVRFVHLVPPSDELARRVAERDHEFMPPSLLASQLDSLEIPTGEPDVVTVTPAADVRETVARALRALEQPG